jgi:hypothetical protein
MMLSASSASSTAVGIYRPSFGSPNPLVVCREIGYRSHHPSMPMLVRLQFFRVVGVIVGAVLAHVLMVIPVFMLVRMMMIVLMDVRMRVLMGVRHSIRMCVLMAVGMGVLVLVRVLVFVLFRHAVTSQDFI